MPSRSLAAFSPRHLNADLHLLDWLDSKQFDYDVISDDDLHREGCSALEPYQVILTGSHPEYWTEPMLHGMETYQSSGGRLMYLGGNGFYWVTTLDSKDAHVAEVRRWGGTRVWEAAPGEYYHSTTGELGGLWRNRGRTPQKMVGVGFTSQGGGRNRPYRRLEASFDPRVNFIFDGIGADEPIGDFPALVLEHGAAGFEIDRADTVLGTPQHALLLATADGFSDRYQLAIEDQLVSSPNTGGSQNSLVRSDMVYFEGPCGGAVFSVSSISWCSCLSHNTRVNNVSRITENVLRRFASDNPIGGID
jgi:N,N-dimethylformamidase